MIGAISTCPTTQFNSTTMTWSFSEIEARFSKLRTNRRTIEAGRDDLPPTKWPDSPHPDGTSTIWNKNGEMLLNRLHAIPTPRFSGSAKNGTIDLETRRNCFHRLRNKVKTAYIGRCDRGAQSKSKKRLFIRFPEMLN